MRKRTKLVLLLSLLSPFIGEVVSGSSPPFEFFNPITFLFLWGLYGGGVLLVRELWVAWGGGCHRLMVLGVAYGIIEEGIAVKSFFDPGWMDLGSLAVYGRYFGINFVWSVWLSIYHAVFSITIPILIIHSLYPEYREKRLLSRKGLKIITLIFLFIVSIIFFFLNPYRPPWIQYVVTVLIVFLLFKNARDWAGWKWVLPVDFPIKRPVISGIIFTSTMLFLFGFIPETFIPPVLPCLVAVIFLFGLYRVMGEYSRKKTIGLSLGLLIPFLLFFDLILEINGMRGMSIVGLLSFLILFHKYRKIENPAQNQRSVM